MPRCPRVLSNCNTYHVMIRGNEKKSVFLDDEDRERFIDTLWKVQEHNTYSLYAYCLMDNHVHLLLKEEKDSVSKIMKRLSVSYVYFFNKKHRRVGHLFQDRFRSETIENDAYLLAAAKYIHNNPVKARIVQRPEDYRWSSYGSYIGKGDNWPGLIHKEFLLGMLSDDKINALRHFEEYTNAIHEEISIKNVFKEEGHRVMEDSEVWFVASKLLEKYDQTVDQLRACKDKKQRNIIIGEIKTKTNASVRQLSRVLGVSKDIIFRS